MNLRKNYLFTVNIERGEDGHFVVSVPALPGCFSQGDTYEEALAMAEDAIHGYLQLAIERGETIPVEKKPSEKVMLAVRFPSLAIT
ncbi:MAG: type II toxin-antitoxin system HicB family antitoxin [Patescibacteria group bacterium]